MALESHCVIGGCSVLWWSIQSTGDPDMCLKLPHTDQLPTPMIADEDIICFKVLRDDGDGLLASPYREYIYVAGETEHLDGDMRIYHDTLWQVECVTVTTGLHTFVELSAAQWERDDWGRTGMTVYAAVIPKGAKYYKGKHGYFNKASYTSDQLLVLPIDDPRSVAALDA